MAKHLILAVAGSGKTSFLIDKLDLHQRFLLVTYTTNNLEALKSRVIKKFGYIPANVMIYSYFSFLYSCCFLPFLKMKLNVKGIFFEACPNTYAAGDSRYISNNGWLYSNRLAKLLEEKNVLCDVRARIEKYYDVLMIDEVQDFAGHDFNFLTNISQSNIEMHFVGDFFQHTFDTSRDGNVNSSLHNDRNVYIERFTNAGFIEDVHTLSHSHRCSPTICRFVQDNLNIAIQSHRGDETEIRILSVLTEIEPILQDNSVIKLFYQDRKKYPLFSKNWGECKGDDNYMDVCVALNDSSMKNYKNGGLSMLVPQTKNKLYVALTRTRNRLFLIPEKVVKHLKN
jgi:DNA helicase II / ATP-dependent DNA helicase PcrA